MIKYICLQANSVLVEFAAGIHVQAIRKLISVLYDEAFKFILFRGGPLQVSHRDARCVYDIVAVIASGFDDCGPHPSLNTRVSPYLDWIESIVWP